MVPSTIKLYKTLILFPHDTAVSVVAVPPNNQNRVANAPPPPPFPVTPVQEPSTINWDKVFYVVFLDMETTGMSQRNNKVIELVAVILDKDGVQIEDGTFVSYV
jgi:Exonuclease